MNNPRATILSRIVARSIMACGTQREGQESSHLLIYSYMADFGDLASKVSAKFTIDERR
jgi:hypothetical protein